MKGKRARNPGKRPRPARRRGSDPSPSGTRPGGDLLETAQAVTDQSRRLREQSMALAEAQRTLAEANQRFADLYDFVPLPYLVVSSLGIIEHVNDAGLQFLGGQREWIVGRPLFAYVETEDMRRVMDSVLGSPKGVSQATEVHLRGRVGTRVVQMITWRRPPHDDSQHATFHIAIVDLTDMRRLENERHEAERARRQSEEAERLARAASDAKDEFLAMLSHELRTPLTPILAAADSLVAHGGLPADLRAKIDIIRRNVKVEARLIDDLLDVARITRRTLDVNRRPIDLHRVLSDLLDGWVTALQEREIALHVRLEAGDHWVDGDPGRLGQVFRNLVSNAAKFTDSGGRISVTSEARDGRMRITVEDTGSGMTEAQVESLFKPFRPTDQRSARHGLGLGLVISYAIVAAHEGVLRISSGGPGRGTTACVELAAAPPLVDEQVPAPQAATAPATAKILLVEDDRDSAEMLTMLLSLEGFQVEKAASVHAALERAQRCDVLVSDIALPDGTGLDLMQKIRAHGGSMRGIALSGYGSAQDVRRSLDAGFEEHLTKPVDLERLVEAVRRLTEPR